MKVTVHTVHSPVVGDILFSFKNKTTGVLSYVRINVAYELDAASRDLRWAALLHKATQDIGLSIPANELLSWLEQLLTVPQLHFQPGDAQLYHITGAPNRNVPSISAEHRAKLLKGAHDEH